MYKTLAGGFGGGPIPQAAAFPVPDLALPLPAPLPESGSLPGLETRVRQLFPETWIWVNLESK